MEGYGGFLFVAIGGLITLAVCAVFWLRFAKMATPEGFQRALLARFAGKIAADERLFAWCTAKEWRPASAMVAAAVSRLAANATAPDLFQVGVTSRGQLLLVRTGPTGWFKEAQAYAPSTFRFTEPDRSRSGFSAGIPEPFDATLVLPEGVIKMMSAPRGAPAASVRKFTPGPRSSIRRRKWPSGRRV